jgi:hypothetical protein
MRTSFQGPHIVDDLLSDEENIVLTLLWLWEHWSCLFEEKMRFLNKRRRQGDEAGPAGFGLWRQGCDH